METSGCVSDVKLTDADKPSCHVCGSIVVKYQSTLKPVPSFVPTVIYRCVSCGTTNLPESVKTATTTMIDQAQELKDTTQEKTDNFSGQKALTDLQLRMTRWGIKCFGLEHMSDKKLRGLRLLEEALEFAQALDIPLVKIIELVTYIYKREAGTAEKELGGIMVTTMAAASAMNLRLWDATLDEVARVESKSTEHFAQRNEVKNKAGFGKV